MQAEVAAQAEHVMLWAPVAFGTGAAIYFGLKREPDTLWATMIAVLGVSLAVGAQAWGRSRALAAVSLLAAFALAGFAGAGLKTRLISAPVVLGDLHVVTIEGRVIDVANPSNQRSRLLIAPFRISRLRTDDLPARVRITVDAGSIYGPGTPIRAVAILNPPPGPASPGAYDFARDAYFDRLGGVGAALKPVQVIDLPKLVRLDDRIAVAINTWRWRLARRLGEEMEAITGETGGGAGLVVTVATSHEGWLAPEAEDDLRASGLAHMLAIAGLHTAAVSGFVFLALRMGVAAWPWLALRAPGKKIAAVGALMAVLTYLILSGAHPPAKRAAITASVAFIAILFDRRAVSLHSLALAALAILVMQPEAVTQPGFQMSFCATAALVAVAERLPRRTRTIQAPLFVRILQGGRDVATGLALVSLVAGAATAPFAIQHFNRVAFYGTFANLTADFIASAILMPSLVAGVMLDALGAPDPVVGLPLHVAGWGAGAILWLGHLFGTAPGAVFTAASAPEIALVLAFCGIVFACLWKGRLRWIGLPLAFAVAFWPRPPPPVAWIAQDAGNAAVVAQGKVVPMKPLKRTFATESWAQHRGFAKPDGQSAGLIALHDRLFDCDRSSCTAQADPALGVAPRVAAWFSPRPPKPGRLEALCAGAEIVVVNAPTAPPAACDHVLLLSGADLARHGATEVFRDRLGWRLIGAQAQRGSRPWSRPSTELSDSGG